MDPKDKQDILEAITLALVPAAAPVTQETCDKKSKEVLDAVNKVDAEVRSFSGKLLGISHEFNEVSSKLSAHKAWHNGSEHTVESGRAKTNSVIRMLGFILAVTIAVGGMIWTVSKISQPSPEYIAHAVAKAINSRSIDFEDLDDVDEVIP